MKENTRRPKHKNDSRDHSNVAYTARLKLGLGDDHDGGRRGSAKDVKEAKTFERRRRRREESSDWRDDE